LFMLNLMLISICSFTFPTSGAVTSATVAVSYLTRYPSFFLLDKK